MGRGLIPNSEAARFDWKQPLTRLATLATLSPWERVVIDLSFQPSPGGEGGPLPALSPAGAGRAFARRRVIGA